MTFLAVLCTLIFGGAIGWLFGYWTGTHPGWTAPIVVWIKSQPWKKQPPKGP